MIFDIQRASMVDGPGFRTTVFFKGCNLRCEWCHNPESQSFERELLFYKERCTGCGTCAEVCPNRLAECTLCGACTERCPSEARVLCGREYSVEEIMTKITADRLFYKTTGGGATFSGGECMLQPELLEKLLAACRQREIHTVIDTAGHIPFSSFERLLPLTDMFLYDVKHMDPEVHRKYTGVSNELILENLAKLLKMRKRVWVRVPVIPGVNDTVENIQALRAFLLQYGYPEKVELLAYHRMGEGKRAALKRKGLCFDVPEKEKMEVLNRAMLP